MPRAERLGARRDGASRISLEAMTTKRTDAERDFEEWFSDNYDALKESMDNTDAGLMCAAYGAGRASRDAELAEAQRRAEEIRAVVDHAADMFQDYEPLEESQHWSDCPLVDGYWDWDEVHGTSALTEEIVLTKCECSMAEMLRIIVARRQLARGRGEKG